MPRHESTSRPPREWALRYAQRGWHVFPVHSTRSGACSCGQTSCPRAAKHPRTRHGLDDATTDPDQIRAWWTRWPDAGIAVATGPSGLWVVDVDGPTGLETLSRLEAEHGDPGGVPVRTGGAGWHLYYRRPEGVELKNTASRIGPGIDTRGQGGYVVAPPAGHVSGRAYRWHAAREPVQPPPRWLVELALTPAATAARQGAPHPPLPPLGASTDRGDSWYAAAARGCLSDIAEAPPGQRNTALNGATYRLAQLAARRPDLFRPAAVFAAVSEAAAAAGLPDREIAATFRSAWRSAGQAA